MTSDRDRLIELVDKAKEEYAGDVTDHTEIDYIVETLLNEGVIVPPCKVGDKVYYINSFYQHNPIIIKCEVDALHITSGKNQIGHKKSSYVLIRNESMKSLSTRVYFDNFGKTVFLTKEEAEEKLKECDNNDR